MRPYKNESSENLVLSLHLPIVKAWSLTVAVKSSLTPFPWRTRHNRLQLAQAIPVAAIPVDLVQPSAYAYSPQINTGRHSIELQIGTAVLKLPPDTSPHYIA